MGWDEWVSELEKDIGDLKEEENLKKDAKEKRQLNDDMSHNQ